MTDNKNIPSIPAEKFRFVQRDKTLHDVKFNTKPRGFLSDALYRFKKNKGSVVAAVIIAIMVLFAIIAPMVSPYTVAYQDESFGYCYPKSHISQALGWDFWDGGVNKEHSAETFLLYYSMGVETGHNAVKGQKYEQEGVGNFKYRLDTYQKAGCIFKNLTLDEYLKIQKYQDETGIQVIYPITESSKRPKSVSDSNNANYWFETRQNGSKTSIVYTKNADGTFSFNNIYRQYSTDPSATTEIVVDGEVKTVYRDAYLSKVFVEGETAENRLYDYARVNQTGFEVRINYYEYYICKHTYIDKDGITEPIFLFGTDANGKDLFTCLGGGARLSFILAIVVSLVNMIVGALYGAVEGYYGGSADLIMERISDILSAVPFMIVITLLKMHMKSSPQLLILFISFFLTGWIGMASQTRMQFYRFKNQEYVLAARTLGARDGRIMFKHIFPNALGTLVTGQVLVIPAMIFSESSLSYLGIINLSTGNLTSVGTLLASADPYLSSYPYMMVFPAVFISLLMLSFNLFGNGLRDAFNPSLRGSED